MNTILDECFAPQPKSKVKAGNGLNEGKYKFFTSSPVQSKYLDEWQYDKEALIFGTGGNASVHYCNEPFSTSTDCLVMYGKDGVNLKMIYYYLLGHIHLLQDGFKGAGLQHISKGYILNISINLPTYEEQMEIVKVFDMVTKAEDLLNRKLEWLDELVKSRFVEMFGDSVMNSMSWPEHQLSEYIEFLTSGSRGWAKYFTDNGEYFITIKNVKNCKITTDNIQHIVPPNNAEAKRTKVRSGDLLISITADLGRTGVVTDEIAAHGAYINQHLSCIRLKEGTLNPLYVAFFMESEAGKMQFVEKNQSAVKAGLNFNSINTLNLLVPPKQLQDSFAAFVEDVDKSKLVCTLLALTIEILQRREKVV